MTRTALFCVASSLAALCCVAPGCAVTEPLRVTYTPAGGAGPAAWFIEERGTTARRQYIVVCHAARTPPCARVLPRSVRSPEQVRDWIATAEEPRRGEQSAAGGAASEPGSTLPRENPGGAESDATMGNVAVMTPGGWANVYTEDGRFLGQTPLSFQAEAGRRVLTLRPFGQPAETPPTVTVDVVPGQTARVVLDVEGYR